MRPNVRYIELKSGYSDNGPAWIAEVEFSKTGKTVYFNGMALEHIGARGDYGNHEDRATGDEYWISGLKKDGYDRHWAGGGTIQIDGRIAKEYLAFRGLSELRLSRYTLVNIPPTDKDRFIR